MTIIDTGSGSMISTQWRWVLEFALQPLRERQSKQAYIMIRNPRYELKIPIASLEKHGRDPHIRDDIIDDGC
jgi:hypothetical protein